MTKDIEQISGYKGVVLGAIGMIVVVVASNILVQYPINDWLTWGAFTYPVAFFVTDLTNRHLGPAKARQVVMVGFPIAVVLSIVFADVRIAVASGSAFLIAQMLDVSIFNWLRQGDGGAPRSFPQCWFGGRYGAVFCHCIRGNWLALDHLGSG